VIVYLNGNGKSDMIIGPNMLRRLFVCISSNFDLHLSLLHGAHGHAIAGYFGSKRRIATYNFGSPDPLWRKIHGCMCSSVEKE
jgi:hypothetical protein